MAHLSSCGNTQCFCFFGAPPPYCCFAAPPPQSKKTIQTRAGELQIQPGRQAGWLTWSMDEENSIRARRRAEDWKLKLRIIQNSECSSSSSVVNGLIWRRSGWMAWRWKYYAPHGSLRSSRYFLCCPRHTHSHWLTIHLSISYRPVKDGDLSMKLSFNIWLQRSLLLVHFLFVVLSLAENVQEFHDRPLVRRSSVHTSRHPLSNG